MIKNKPKREMTIGKAKLFKMQESTSLERNQNDKNGKERVQFKNLGHTTNIKKPYKSEIPKRVERKTNRRDRGREGGRIIGGPKPSEI